MGPYDRRAAARDGVVDTQSPAIVNTILRRSWGGGGPRPSCHPEKVLRLIKEKSPK